LPSAVLEVDKLCKSFGGVHAITEAIQTLPDYTRVARGITRTFQTASLFPDFTVREQIMLGCDVKLDSHPLTSVFGTKRYRAEHVAATERVQQVLALTGLAEVADHTVATISSAQQRFLMIATAMASAPKVILLDEPAAGLISSERDTLCDLIRSIREQGTAVLVIEHHMALIMEVCDRILVLNFGSQIAEGTATEIRQNQAVIDAYLGEAA